MSVYWFIFSREGMNGNRKKRPEQVASLPKRLARPQKGTVEDIYPF